MITTARRDEGGRTKAVCDAFYDFARRVDLKRVGKRPLEMLARCRGRSIIADGNRRRRSMRWILVKFIRLQSTSRSPRTRCRCW